MRPEATGSEAEGVDGIADALLDVVEFQGELLVRRQLRDHGKRLRVWRFPHHRHHAAPGPLPGCPACVAQKPSVQDGHGIGSRVMVSRLKRIPGFASRKTFTMRRQVENALAKGHVGEQEAVRGRRGPPGP